MRASVRGNASAIPINKNRICIFVRLRLVRLRQIMSAEGVFRELLAVDFQKANRTVVKKHRHRGEGQLVAT